jgi:hypothetical protein
VNETSTSIETIANRIRDCLREEGLEPDLELREGEGIVAARTQIGDDTLRVAVHISTHEFVPSNAGAADAKETRKKLSSAIARPTLEPRSAAGPHDPYRSEVDDAEGVDEEGREEG